MGAWLAVGIQGIPWLVLAVVRDKNFVRRVERQRDKHLFFFVAVSVQLALPVRDTVVRVVG